MLFPPVNNVNVNIYIDDRSSVGVSDAVLNLVRARIFGDGTGDNPGQRSAGVNVATLKPIIVLVDLTLEVSYDDNVNQAHVNQLLERNITQYINGLRVGEDVLRSRLFTVIVGTPGLSDVVLTTPSANILIADTTVARMGIVNLCLEL